MSKSLTKAQRELLEFYLDAGVTAQTDSALKMNTWRACIRRGWLARSHGLGVIETEITPAGRAALSHTKETDHEG